MSETSLFPHLHHHRVWFYFHDKSDINCHCCVSKAELHRSALIPRSVTYRESRQIFNLLCCSSPPSRCTHCWFSDSSQYFMITPLPRVKLTSVRHKSMCLIWPRLVSVHSWLPPVISCMIKVSVVKLANMWQSKLTCLMTLIKSDRSVH